MENMEPSIQKKKSAQKRGAGLTPDKSECLVGQWPDGEGWGEYLPGLRMAKAIWCIPL